MPTPLVELARRHRRLVERREHRDRVDSGAAPLETLLTSHCLRVLVRGEHRLGLQLDELLDRVLHVLLGAPVLARLAELRDLPIDRLALRRLALHDHDEVQEAHRVGVQLGG